MAWIRTPAPRPSLPRTRAAPAHRAPPAHLAPAGRLPPPQRAAGPGGRLEADVSAWARSRVRAVQRDFDFQALEWSLRDLEATLGLDRQLALGEDAGPPATAAMLEETARRLNNQLQLTPPRRYAARTLNEATERLFKRYVSHRLVPEKAPPHLTHAQLRDLIWRRVKQWSVPNHQVERGGLLAGKSATHPADIVLRNGQPRAGIFAIPTYHGDDHLAYLYRDRIPTIALDMGEGFQVYAVLPKLSDLVDEGQLRFAAETRELLASLDRVSTLELHQLDAIRPQLERLLVGAG